MSEISRIVLRLKKAYEKDIGRTPSHEELKKFEEFCEDRNLTDLEAWFCPEDWFYVDVLKLLNPDDVVFDVGAGDLRFAIIASQMVKKVYAVEINPTILGRALTVVGYDLPSNVIPICADAWSLQLPSDVTVITCLMIHRARSFPREWLSKRIIYTRREGIFVVENGKLKEVYYDDEIQN
ncbi:hypothetical protein [Archaeoglobus sp.]